MANSIITRRRVLRGLFGGTSVCVGLPLFDALFDAHGEALADGGGSPLRFGTWFWGCGMNPERWVPNDLGHGYTPKEELAIGVGSLREKVSVLSGYGVELSGRTNYAHVAPPITTLTGIAPRSETDVPGESFDRAIARELGDSYPVLNVTADGTETGWSSAGEGALERAHNSPLDLYNAVFGDGSTVGADPTADLVRQSVLSAVLEQTKELERELGARDRQRLELYFDTVRSMENQLERQLESPPALEACGEPSEPNPLQFISELDVVIEHHNLMADIVALALACDQTRVVNINLWREFTDVKNPEGEDSSLGYHGLTHQEPFDDELGYQVQCQVFVQRAMECWNYLLTRLDDVQEGNGTLLDHMAVFAHSGTEYAKAHGTTNIPLMIAGSACGRLDVGAHLAGNGEPNSAVVLALLQAYGVPVTSFGTADHESRAPADGIIA